MPASPANNPTGGADEQQWSRQLETDRLRERSQERIRTGGGAVRAASAAAKTAGRGAELAGKGTELAGKGTELAGKGVEVAGKGVQAAGAGISAAGAALSGTGIGAIVGVPLAILGKGVQGAGVAASAGGKGIQAGGKAVKGAGQGLRRAGRGARQFGAHAGDVAQSLQQMGPRGAAKMADEEAGNAGRAAGAPLRLAKSAATDITSAYTGAGAMGGVMGMAKGGGMAGGMQEGAKQFKARVIIPAYISVWGDYTLMTLIALDIYWFLSSCNKPYTVPMKAWEKIYLMFLNFFVPVIIIAMLLGMFIMSCIINPICLAAAGIAALVGTIASWLGF